MYDYDKPTFGIYDTGQIRMVEPDGEHYLKPYSSQGTFAFRFDSLLSHLSIMKGYHSEKALYPLPQGRVLPAAMTDEAVRGGVYFYGSLNQCPKAGRGKWLPSNHEVMSERMQSICSAGIVSIVEATNIVAGPKSGSNAQWAKCGSGPTCVRVIGCIIAEPFAECVYGAIPRSSEVRKNVLDEFQNILQNPHRYLHPACLGFLHRYLAGGCLGAYGDWVPLRCVWKKIWVEKQQQADMVNLILKECVVSFFRDDSWEDGRLTELKTALHTWLQDGLPPNKGKLYVDPLTENEYSQMEIEPIYSSTSTMEGLVEASTILPFRCCLHKLIVDVVGVTGLVRLPEKDLPGTRLFHNQYRDVLIEKYGMKYDEEPLASPALLTHASNHAAAASLPMSASSASQPNATDKPATYESHEDVGRFLSKEVVNVMFPWLMPKHEGFAKTGRLLAEKGAEKTQQGPSQFLHLKRPSMVKFVVARINESPGISWNDLAVALTEHVVSGRTRWRWKQLAAESNGPHLFTSDDEIGRNMSLDLLQHVSEKGDVIREAVVEQLRLKRQKVSCQ